MFALQHPDLVAGMVLVDARSEYVDTQTSPTEAQAFQQGMAGGQSFLGVARNLGLVRLLSASQWGSPAMSEKTRTEIALLNTAERSRDTTTAEAQGRAADDTQLQTAPSLGDRPLFALASEQNTMMIPSWTEAQKQQAALSTKGHLIIAKGSGHYIHWEQPALVVDAVRQAVAQVRKQ